MCENKFLPLIDSPDDIKRLNYDELQCLAGELREYIVDVVSKNGGHLAPSLGVVELTLALHKVFSTPKDKIIFDVGHQSYVHKIITGRREKFVTLRQYNGISGFPKRSESVHDAFGTGHSSTSISAALGMAFSRDLRGDDYNVVAVIGDGAMTGGLAFEALNNAGIAHKKLIVVLNDNEMSIARNVGALSEYLSALRTGKTYNSVKKKLAELLGSMEYGDSIITVVRRLKGSIKHLIVPTSVFEELGFTYLGPVDGHDIKALTDVFEGAKDLNVPVLIHVLTKKGKGYKPAEDNPNVFHGTGPFDVETGEKINCDADIPTYTEVFGEALVQEGMKDTDIVAITAAMPDGTGLRSFLQHFPDRYFDVGIAEQHAVTMAAGMAAEGLKPVVAVYSSFLQRAYDSVLHDVCVQNLHVILCLDRSGLVGDDGPTHHGLFDFVFLRTIPNMVVMAPKDENELQWMLHTALRLNKPVAIRYPRGRGVGAKLSEPEQLSVGRAEIIQSGRDVVLWAVGSMVHTAKIVADILMQDGINAGIVNVRFVKPLDRDLLSEDVKKYSAIVTLEEGMVNGGAGSGILEALNDMKLLNVCRVLNIGVEDKFVPHGDIKLLKKELKIDAVSVAERIKQWLS